MIHYRRTVREAVACGAAATITDSITTTSYWPYVDCPECRANGAPLRNCMLCGKSTTGSVGAAGIKWSMICQPCKDVEDAALMSVLVHKCRRLYPKEAI